MSIQDINPNEDFRDQRDGGDEEFPGYPHYPSSEDITHPSNGVKKVSADLDQVSRNQNLSNVREEDTGGNPGMAGSDLIEDDDDDLVIVPGTEADVTKDDLIALGPREGDMDMGDDEILRGKIQPTGIADEQLDIPGSELDDATEEIGEEDEENNYYSLGGDRHENLDEDNQQENESDEYS